MNLLLSRCGILVIASAYITEGHGFESSQDVRFLGLNTFAALLSRLAIHRHCVNLRKINSSKKIILIKKIINMILHFWPYSAAEVGPQ
jgi:hypothetical protein